MNLSHVNITMAKGGEDLARAFYHGLLGLPEVPKPEALRGRGGVWFDVNGRDVHEAVFGVLALESEPVDPRL